YIQRSMLSNGDLDTLITRDQIKGITSNPSIFESAIANSDEYDEQIRVVLSESPDMSAEGIFKALAIKDIQDAADALLPTYQASRGDDGMVSLEVSPTLAHDASATIAEARELHAAIDKPNVMIKVPGTKAGVEAFEALTALGISVNVTLLFSVERYREIVQAYVNGLTSRLQQGQDISKIASVASFFVSRVDVAVDKALANVDDQSAATALMGDIAIANAKVAYGHYQNVFHSAQFDKLAAAGAIPQRLLWASTATKNPDYSDVYYVEELMGPDTVNTVPPKTMDAFRDHGTVANKLAAPAAQSQALLDQLAALGVNLQDITEQLEKEGIDAFATAFERLLQAITDKCQTIKAA
ncbi:MAG: transaldolase, partial [Pseudomonadota bacterium]